MFLQTNEVLSQQKTYWNHKTNWIPATVTQTCWIM